MRSDNQTERAGISPMKHTNKTKGLTLVELAVVLVIMGLIGTVFYSTITRFIGKLKEDEAQEEVLVAQEKVRGFVFGKNGTLPASDTGDLLPRELGEVTDPWGQRLHYHPASELVSDSVDDVDTTSLDVNFYTDGDLTTLDRTVSDVAYVVISLGPNQQQDYTVSSVNIVSPTGTRTKSDGTEFDDIVEYITLPELKSGRVQDTDPAPGGYGFRLSEFEQNPTPGTLQGDAQFVSGQTEGDGVVLSLDGSGDYVDLSDEDVNDIATYNYTTYTVMGWFKTNNTDTSEFDTITNRESDTDTPVWENRTWWITLWDSGFTTNGDGVETAGELANKCRNTANQDIVADSEYPDPPGEPAHHDTEWHFFAAVMSFDGSDYTSTIFITDDRDGEALLRETTDFSKAVSSTPPKVGANYHLYIGWSSSGRYFNGLIDELIIYDEALTDDEIVTYYDQTKRSYGF